MDLHLGSPSILRFVIIVGTYSGLVNPNRLVLRFDLSKTEFNCASVKSSYKGVAFVGQHLTKVSVGNARGRAKKKLYELGVTVSSIF